MLLSTLLHAGLTSASWLPPTDDRQMAFSDPVRVAQPSSGVSLSALSAEEYTVLEHPAHPRHAVRIRKIEGGWCEPNATSYNGYLDVDQDKHFHFFFFESRSNPAEDDWLVWLQGGPGGSSALAMVTELGPCWLNAFPEGGTYEFPSKDALRYNEHSWNSHANTIFLDQPIDVGYSYHTHGRGQTTKNADESARDLVAFLQLFQTHFSEFQGRPFHITGESYGGRYIPVYASHIVDSNARVAASNATDEEKAAKIINLESVMIGNGYTDPHGLTISYYNYTCQSHPSIDASTNLPPVLSIEQCVTMHAAIPRCRALYRTECEERFDQEGCTMATEFCLKNFIAPFETTGRNQYKITEKCTAGNDFCWGAMNNVTAYFSAPSVREHLHIPSDVNFTAINEDVHERYVQALDMSRVSTAYVAGILERGVRVLIYVGTLDWICNWLAQVDWTSKLDWSGASEFRAQSLEEWRPLGDGTAPAGKTKSALGLTLTTIYGGGHMVPMDQPEVTLKMVDDWIAAGK